MISFKNVSKNFGTLKAVDNVTFSISAGSCFGLLGPNGAGKTTLVKILLDLVRADSGEITTAGISSRSFLSRLGMGFVGESVTFPTHLSAFEILKRSASLASVPAANIHGLADELLKTCGLEGRGKDRCGNYSKGMKQRLALASALMHKPKVLILDEPTSGLDPIGIMELRKLLEKLRAEGMTLLLNSHLLSEAEKLCDEAGILHKGRLLASGKMDEIVKDSVSLEEVFMKTVGAAL